MGLVDVGTEELEEKFAEIVNKLTVVTELELLVVDVEATEVVCFVAKDDVLEEADAGEVDCNVVGSVVKTGFGKIGQPRISNLIDI